MIEERVGFRIQGKVQGVGYRLWARQAASQLGVRGAIRNLKDGSVELHVAGPPDAVSRLETWLRQGPPGARVAGVVRTASRLPIPSEGFKIEHTA